MDTTTLRDFLTCPIGQEIIETPVWLHQDSRFYKREQLTQAYQVNQLSPINRALMRTDSQYLPIHGQVKRFIEANQHAYKNTKMHFN